MLNLGYKDVAALLGGWNEWKTRHERNPDAYPLAVGIGLPGEDSSQP